MFSGRGQAKEKAEDVDPELGPTSKVDVPSTFQGWCALICRVLAPAEELSPFKLGQVQKLISDVNADVGLFVAPAFVMGQVVFLVAFCLYLVTAIVAIVVDFNASGLSGDSSEDDKKCAEQSWVWLFVLLATAIPTGLGFVMGLVKTGLNALNLKRRYGWEVPPALLSFPGPVMSVVLGIFGIILWAGMTQACAGHYSTSEGLLFVVFKLQVIMFGVAAIFGALTTFSQCIVFMNSLHPEDPDLTALKKSLDEAEVNLKEAEREYVKGAEQIVAKLKKQVAEAERERDDAKAQVKAEAEEPFSFTEFSAMIVQYLAPVEEISPFKLSQVQELIAKIHKETGDAVAPYFAFSIVFFLLAFTGYVVMAVLALVLDFKAMDADCAADSWVWLFVLLAVVIPTSLGFVMGIVKAALLAADLKNRVGWEVPAVALSLPGPILYIVLGVLGIILWATMDNSCADWYAHNTGMLLVIFKIQVILLGVAAVLGVITCVAQFSVMIAQLSGQDEEDRSDSSKSV